MQRFSVRRRNLRIVLHTRQRLVHHIAPGAAAEYLFADGLHDRSAQNALHHAQLHVMRGIVEHPDLRLRLTREQSSSSIPPKIFGDDNRRRGLAFANQFPRGIQSRWLDIEGRLTGELRDKTARNVAPVLIDHQHRNFADLGIAALTAEEVAKERCQQNRNHKADNHGPPVIEEEFQVFAD